LSQLGIAGGLAGSTPADPTAIPPVVAVPAQTGYVDINNVRFEVNGDMTIRQFMEMVNNHPTAGVSLSFSATNGQFSITPTGVGDDARIQIGYYGRPAREAVPGNPNAAPGTPAYIGTPAYPGSIGLDEAYIFRFMGFGTMEYQDVGLFHPDGITPLYAQARDANGDYVFDNNNDPVMVRVTERRAVPVSGQEGQLNWVANVEDERMIRRASDAIIIHDINSPMGGVEMRSSNNEFEMNGIFINVASAGPGQIFSINTTQDTEDVFNMITEFINYYNELIRELNSMHTTPRPTQSGNRSFFEPLTDEQRNAMSEREIELWEARAREGLFHRDPMIRNLHNELRRMMFDPVRLADGSQLALFNIGIESVGMDGARSDRMMGILTIDEDRLREALDNNLEGVRALFSQSPVQAGVQNGTALERNAAAPQLGVAWRLRNTIQNHVLEHNSPFRQRAGAESGSDGSSLMERQLRTYDQRIDQMQTFLQRRENHFFQMFARMEQAMAQSNAQMESLWAFAGM
jgi:hypothetical protein